MPETPPIGSGYYAQFYTFGISMGVGTTGGFGLTVYTQVGAGVGAAGGASFSSSGVSPYAAVGFASVTGAPGAAWSALYDFPTGHVFFSEGAGVSDFYEAGIYQEFPSWSDFKNWYDEHFPDEPALPSSPPSEGELGQPSTGLLQPLPPPGLPGAPPLPRDPLIFDLTGEGIALQSLGDSHAFFDYGNDGFRERTGWVGVGQGILVNDPGAGNSITATNVIGAVGGSGFGELSTYDTNQDGLIDSGDAAFNALKIWIDSDGNGLSNESEIHSLPEIGISQISLESQATYSKNNGNTVVATSTFTMIDPTTQQSVVREIAQVDFLTNTQLSRPTLPDGMTYTGLAVALPQIDGYGLLSDLRVAASLNNDLALSAKQLVLDSAWLSAADFEFQFESLLQEWAGTATIDPSSAGNYIDARHLAFVYKYYGIETSVQNAYPSQPNAATANLYEEIYRDIVASMEARFIAQIPPALWRFGVDPVIINDHPLMPFVLVQYNSNTDRLAVDLNDLTAAFKSHEPTDLSAREQYWSKVLTALSALRADLFEGDEQVFLGHFVAAAKLSDYPGELVQDFVSILSPGASLVEANSSGEFIGDSGVDVLYGNADSSIFNAGAGDDLILGARGDDFLNGASGNDTYLYARGDGNDTINETTSNGTADTLSFTDLNPADVTLVRNGNDVTVVIAESASGAGDGGSVLLKNSLDDYYEQGVEKVTFADGTVWTRAKIRDLLASNAGTAGSDTINGTNAADILAGRHGDDVLDGGWQNDTYLYARGDGNDTINETTSNGTADTLSLTDLNPADVTLVRNGNDVTVVIAESAAGAGDGGSVLLKNSLDDYYEQGVEKVTFADGTVWTKAQIRQMLLDQAATAGNDTIVGFNSADTLAGRHGDDTLNGGWQNDTYLYARGDGNDTINETTSNGTADTLSFSDLNPADVTLVRNGNDVTVVIAESASGAGDGGSVLLKNSLDDYYEQGVEKVTFADGTVWTKTTIRQMLLDQAATAGNDTITGFNTNDLINASDGNDTVNAAGGNDLITGGHGDDILDGADGNDSYVYARGDGNDTIFDDVSGSSDKLTFSGVNASDLTLVQNGNDVTLLIRESVPGANDTGSIVLKGTLGSGSLGVDSITFGDGQVWTRAVMAANVSYVGGTSADETITGSAGSDKIYAGEGSDRLVGLAGSDTYVYHRGDGNDIIEEQTSGTAMSSILTI
jgi:Ca2+-binding RTX toxin-like protein